MLHDNPKGHFATRGKSLNFRLCVDGALRGNGSAAAGMALLAYTAEGESIVLQRGGLLLENVSSAFLSEMLVLEWALTYFRDWYAYNL